MTSNRDHFDSFAPHTLLKHAVYGHYVQRWAYTLLSRWNTVRVVDACAGEGVDQKGNPGSPLIALNEGVKAATVLTPKTGIPKSVELVAIEKAPANFKRLSEHLGPHRNVRLENGTLADVIASLEPDFARVPHLFFIDPFGLSPLQAEVIRRALAGPRNEIFLLFAGPAIRRHFGSYAAAQPVESPQETLFADLSPELTVVTEPSDYVLRGAEVSEAIMDAAFGGLNWKAIGELPKERRLQEAVALYAQLLTSFGAKRVLPMPIHDHRGHFKYHLIFATKSVRGYTVMKEAMQKGLEKGLVGSEPGMLLGMSVPIREITKAVITHFAGRTEVPWSAEKGSKGETVRSFALEDTPAMHDHLKALRRELEPYATGGRSNARIYTFPAA